MLVLCQDYHHLYYDTSMCYKAGIQLDKDQSTLVTLPYFGVTPEVLAHSANVGLAVLGGL